jgi:hypothetical protein
VCAPAGKYRLREQKETPPLKTILSGGVEFGACGAGFGRATTPAPETLA